MFSLTTTRSRALLTTLFLSLSFLLTSCGGSGKNHEIDGISGPHLELQDDGLMVVIEFENLVMEGGLQIPIKDYEHSYIELGPAVLSEGTLMQIYVSFEDVFGNGDYLRTLDPQTLPGGRRIPGISGGRLPAVAFTVPDFHNISFYLGEKVYGIFVPVDLGFQGGILTFRHYSGSARVGTLSLVGEDAEGLNSGLFLAIDLNSRAAKYVKKKML